MKNILIIIEILDRLLKSLHTFFLALVFLDRLLEHIRKLTQMLELSKVIFE
jgi:hypothetical protein